MAAVESELEMIARVAADVDAWKTGAEFTDERLRATRVKLINCLFELFIL
jgi:hypothetical protein